MVDDERSFPGMPVLDRQDAPEGRDARGRRPAPSRVPETRPTPLQGAFIYLSVVGLICGTIAITALTFGTPMRDPVVRLPILIGALVLVLVTADAMLRIWRSAFAWLPIDRSRGLFRLVWWAVAGLGVILETGAIVLMVGA
ncbi:MAG: hypothetical protein ACHQ15_07950 [Candidatus Limnocylindrales bacterium]